MGLLQGGKTPPKSNRPTRLAFAIQDALKGSGITLDLELIPLWARWTEMVGPVIARHTRPEAVKGTLLLVNVSSSPWLQELQFLKKDIMVKLNAFIGREAVHDIKFQIGPVDEQDG